jgi:GTP-binding protein EngB required for normal cell division
MPIVLFLVVDGKKEISYDKKKYPKVRNNLILSKKYTEEPLYYQDDGYMKNLFIRFCSIHNELGDHFSIGEGKNVIDYDLIRNYYPFNINICVIGRFGQGKSTGVNVLLNEYKAKESSQGGAQTKNLTFYQATNAPIRILDIPGFDSEKNVKLALEKIKMCKEEANKLKDYIHFFLIFLSEEDNRTFSQFESPIMEEIVQYNDSKIIYVVTHSDKDNEEEDNEEFINKINQGIDTLSGVSNKEMMKATKDNVVFVNFYKQKKKRHLAKRTIQENS